MRYLYICLFLLFIPVPLAIIEFLFHATGSGLSIFDTRGVGQVTLLGTVLMLVIGYVHFIARDSIVDYTMLYLREWRRALRGFVVMLLITAGIVFSAYVLAGLFGQLQWNEEALNQLTSRKIERTVVALFVVLILAFTEEMMFRAFLMRYLRENTSTVSTVCAVVFSSLVFTALHNLDNPTLWLSEEGVRLFIGLFLLAVLLCTVYIVTGSIWCSIAVHLGMLGSKVILRRTEILDVQTNSWLLSHADVRMTPLAWMIFAGLALAIYLLRYRINPLFAIERPVISTAK
jgi:membrane protease YdiL (CAAX protease family)